MNLAANFFLVADIMRKYTTTAQKPKRTKSTTRIVFDNAIGKRIAEVAKYNHK